MKIQDFDYFNHIQSLQNTGQVNSKEFDLDAELVLVNRKVGHHTHGCTISQMPCPSVTCPTVLICP